MTHSLTTPPATAVAAISTTTRFKNGNHFVPLPMFQQRGVVVMCSYNQSYSNQTSSEQNLLHRRTTTLGLASTMLGLAFGEGTAMAARKAPPPPSGEKKDPSVGGLTAKVLASKKRKEAMKESMTKLRERGKSVVNEPILAKKVIVPPPPPPAANEEGPPQ